MENISRFFLVSLIIVVLDQLSKFIVRIYGGFVRNTGAGFGILQGQTLFLICFSAAVVIVIAFMLKRILKEDRWVQIFTAFIFGGAIGNLIDRVVLGYVVDFINLGWWPAFNIADSFLTMGVIGLVILLWKK